MSPRSRRRRRQNQKLKMEIAVLLCLINTLVLFLLASMAAEAASSPVTFVFGDSLTDVGNNNYLQYSLARSNYPFYGIDYSGGQATGRFTNGRTIGDFICMCSLMISFIQPLSNSLDFIWLNS